MNLQAFVMIQCKTIYRNYLCTKSMILVIGLKKKIISFFPIEKMAAKYAKIDRVGSLDAGFQQVPPVQNFRNFYNIVI